MEIRYRKIGVVTLGVLFLLCVLLRDNVGSVVFLAAGVHLWASA